MNPRHLNRRQFGRLAISAAIMSLASGSFAEQMVYSRKTAVSIKDNVFLINGKPTYSGRIWKIIPSSRGQLPIGFCSLRDI